MATQIIDRIIDGGISIKWEDDAFVLDINWQFSLNLKFYIEVNNDYSGFSMGHKKIHFWALKTKYGQITL